MKNSLLIFLAAVLVAGCRLTSSGTGNSAVQLDPKRVPTELTLSPATSVLLVTLEASEAGYRLLSVTNVLGAINQAPLGGKDVLVTGLGRNGRVVGTAATFNPRDVHTTGAKNPATSVLASAVFSVRLPKPEEIQAISVEVKAGPNAKLRQTFPFSLAR